MGRFYLMFSTDPPAVDAVRHDNIIFDDVLLEEGDRDVAVDSDLKFKWVKCTLKKKPVYEITIGKVLASGTKTMLEKMIVSPEGKIVANGPGLMSRKKELAKIRSLQLHAQDNVLQDLAEDLLQNGPQQQVSRLPKQRSEEELAEIRRKVQDLPCFQNRPLTTEILKDRGIFLDSGKVAVLRQDMGDEPAKHYQALLNLALMPLKGVDGVSVTGKRNCVGVPTELTETLLLYTTQVFMGLGGDRKKMNFKATSKLSNFLSNGKQKKKRLNSSLSQNSTSRLALNCPSPIVLSASTSQRSTPNTPNTPLIASMYSTPSSSRIDTSPNSPYYVSLTNANPEHLASPDHQYSRPRKDSLLSSRVLNFDNY